MTEPADIDIAVLETGTTVRVRVEGSLDAATVPALVDTVAPLTADAQVLTIDCAGLRFCDSSGLGAFVTLRNALGPDATFALQDATPGLHQILRITGLLDLLA